ncbi:hypothetical protein PSAB6_540070 [Paraburkholderia sabiae]|nr:hypothetical protein PSAB6_540070 [Paraburkholderia sabiae]
MIAGCVGAQAGWIQRLQRRTLAGFGPDGTATQDGKRQWQQTRKPGNAFSPIRRTN